MSNGQRRRSAEQGRQASRPRTKPADVRRDDLMDAAATLFIARGIDATTIDDIVAAADVAKGTFYHYFTAKTDVVVALRDRFSQGFATRVKAAVDARPAMDAVARLQSWTITAVDAYLDAFQLHDVVFHDYRHDRRQSQEKDAVIEQILEILTVGIQTGVWSIGEPRATAMVIFHGMHGVVDDAIADGSPDRGRIVGMLTTMFLRMLRADDRPV